MGGVTRRAAVHTYQCARIQTPPCPSVTCLPLYIPHTYPSPPFFYLAQSAEMGIRDFVNVMVSLATLATSTGWQPSQVRLLMILFGGWHHISSTRGMCVWLGSHVYQLSRCKSPMPPSHTQEQVSQLFGANAFRLTPPPAQPQQSAGSPGPDAAPAGPSGSSQGRDRRGGRGYQNDDMQTRAQVCWHFMGGKAVLTWGGPSASWHANPTCMPRPNGQHAPAHPTACLTTPCLRACPQVGDISRLLWVLSNFTARPPRPWFDMACAALSRQSRCGGGQGRGRAAAEDQWEWLIWRGVGWCRGSAAQVGVQLGTVGAGRGLMIMVVHPTPALMWGLFQQPSPPAFLPCLTLSVPLCPPPSTTRSYWQPADLTSIVTYLARYLQQSATPELAEKLQVGGWYWHAWRVPGMGAVCRKDEGPKESHQQARSADSMRDLT